MKDKKETKIKIKKIDNVELSLSQEKKDFIALIESYKVKNPIKYEAKKVEFEKKLNSLNSIIQ